MGGRWECFKSERGEQKHPSKKIKYDLTKGVGLGQEIREGVASENVKKEEIHTVTWTGYIWIHELTAVPIGGPAAPGQLSLWLCGWTTMSTTEVFLLFDYWISLEVFHLWSPYILKSLSGKKRFPASLLNLYSYWGSVATITSSWTTREDRSGGKKHTQWFWQKRPGFRSSLLMLFKATFTSQSYSTASSQKIQD